MTIQVSIIIWTVICFSLLMFILHNWLFVPVLRVIDERRKKIEDARQKKASIEDIASQNESRIEAQKAEYLKTKKQNEKLFLEELKVEGKKQIEAAQKKRMDTVDDFRTQMKNDYSQIVDSVRPDIEKAAEIFAEKIISHRI